MQPSPKLRVGVALFVRKGGQSLWENGIFQNCLFLALLLRRSPRVGDVVLVAGGGDGGPQEAQAFLEESPVPVIDMAAAMDGLDGAEVLNDVVLNQVLLRFDADDERTTRVVEELQRGGEAWLGGTVWHGMTAARVAFSNWSTTDADVDRLAAALEDALDAARAGSAVR